MLQFGHGCGAVENRRGPADGVLDLVASIRPRLRCRGERGRGGGAGRRGRCFNSATAEVPWRTQPGRARCPTATAGFNSATAEGPWRTVAAPPATLTIW